MSRPTDATRFAQADRWMTQTFGESMPSYLTGQAQVPITGAVRDVVAVLDKSTARELLNQWKEEDALSNAGVKPYITIAGALALLFLHMRLGRVPHIVAITGTLHSLTAANRQALGVDHKIDQLKSYDRIWEAMQRLILLVDEFYVPADAPRARQNVLTGPEFKELVEKRDLERCQRNRARMHELANLLVEGTLRLLPTEVLNRWEGNFAGDATVVAMLGKAGNPSSRDTTRKRRSINSDAGFYRRGGNHAGYTMEDAKHFNAKGAAVKGTSRSKLLWGVEAEIARMTQNATDKSGEFPLLTTALGFHIPGAITGAGAAMVTSMHQRGHRINYCIFDRAYPGGFVRDFHAPIRALGGKLVFDYDANEFGVQGHDPRGFIQVVGSWYLDNLPNNLREIDKPMVDLRETAKRPLSEIADARRRLIDAKNKLARSQESGRTDKALEAINRLGVATAELKRVEKQHRALVTQLDRAEIQHAKKLAQRDQYRLVPKGRMKPDGSRRYIVPDTSHIPLAKPHRFQQKTVIIEADITADKNPGGLKHEQYLTYGTPVWRAIYGLRNSVESVNRNYKRAQNEDLENADRRHVRGNTFTYLVASIAAVCENLRKILSFFKNCLATRPVNAKNSDVPTIYWQPETGTDPVDITLRC